MEWTVNWGGAGGRNRLLFEGVETVMIFLISIFSLFFNFVPDLIRFKWLGSKGKGCFENVSQKR